MPSRKALDRIIEANEVRATGAEPRLLVTKLHPPAVRDHTVARDRLVERLRPRTGIKLTLVAAPAGSGKTTLLGIWGELEAAARPVAWLTLDEGDNDPVLLWSYVLLALRTVCPDLGPTVAPDRVGAARIVETVLPELVNELTAVGEVALVLDDFHRLSRGPARDSVAWLLEHAPPTFQLVIATRSEPALPLAAMRAHGELIELRAADLGFTPAEADVLFNNRLGLSLEREHVDALVKRTEGWPAGLYLAALSLQATRDQADFVSRFGGGSRHVVDFLVGDVLDAHDPSMQALMLRSSILPRMCGSLCDAVLEQNGSAERLRELARTNLFLMPLDDRGEWFRFHHLFAQLLRAELAQREPQLVATLHGRAYAWHRDHGTVDEAIEHALKAGGFAEATDLITGSWMGTASGGRHRTVLGWLESFPRERLRQDPRLLLIRAWMLAQSGNRDETAAASAELEHIEWPDRLPLPDGSSSLEASLATLRAGYPWGDVGAAYENALRAAELQSQESPLWAAVTWSLAMACYYRGDLDRAEEWFGETVQVGLARERWLVAASGLAYRSLIAGEQRQLDEQLQLAHQAATVAREHDLGEIRGEVHVALGVALEAQGQGDEALPYLEHGVAVLRSGQPLEAAMALCELATVLRSMGLSEAERVAVDEASAIIESCPDPGILPERVDALRRGPRGQAREEDSTLSDRELLVLRMLRGPLTERDIGRELYLSHNTIHSHTRSIYRKLGVSSRAEAVERARMLGIR